MRIVFVFILLAFCTAANFAQVSSIESDFEKNKAKFKLEKFAEGEDASSGSDYLYYTKKTEIVKVREIWSSSANPVFRVEDYFFKDGKIAVVVKYTFTKKYYKTALKGANIPLKLVEKLTFTDGKLTAWIENGKTIPTNDNRWSETEKNALESANYKLENYKDFKAERN